MRIPWAATVATWAVIADQVGSIAVDILRANNAVPTVSMIGAGTKPNLAAAQFQGATAPANWTSTTLAADDYLEFNVASVLTVTRATVVLSLLKT